MAERDVVFGFGGERDAGMTLATRNADGTINLTHMDTFQGPDGEDLYANQMWHVVLDPWSSLTLDLWAAGREVAAQIDAAARRWAEHIAYGWPASVVPFDALQWVQYWPTSPIFPDLQIAGAPWVLPDPLTDTSPWTLSPPPLLRPPNGALIFNTEPEPFQYPRIPGLDCGLGISGPNPFELLHCDLDLQQWTVRDPDPGEALPPDTNHGGDRHPGRYA